MAQLIDISPPLFLTHLLGRMPTPAYGKTQDDIEQSVVQFVQAMNQETGISVAVPDAQHARWLEWLGRGSSWLGIVVILATGLANFILGSLGSISVGVGYITAITAIGAMFGIILFFLGHRLRTRSQGRLSLFGELVHFLGVVVLLFLFLITLIADEGYGHTLVGVFSGILLIFTGSWLHTRGQRMLTLDAIRLPKVVVSETADPKWRWVRSATRAVPWISSILVFIAIVGGSWSGAPPAPAFIILFWLGVVGFWYDYLMSSKNLARAERHLQPTASELRVNDKRKPVVLLRSFDDDGLNVPTGVEHGFPDRMSEMQHERFETALSHLFFLLGPLIAAATPSEELPEHGSAREKFAQTEWQDKIRNWMKEARLIIVVAGLGEGLGWELETIANSGYLSKLLVLIPPGEVEQRWQFLRGVFASTHGLARLPKKIPKNVRVLHFSSNSDPVLIYGGGNAFTLRDDYRRAVRFALYGIYCYEWRSTCVATA